MKKYIIFALIIALTQVAFAQDETSTKVKTTDRRIMFDLQIMQHIGLHQWGEDYINEGLPKAMITELKSTFNLYLARPYFGIFLDMGMGFMPAPKMKSLNLDILPMPHNGSQYFVREVISKTEKTGTTTHFIMNFGFFGKIPATEKFSILPYFGIGFFTMPQRKYEIVLKEQGTNMQYRTVYIWNTKGENGNNRSNLPIYLLGKLNLKYKLSQTSSLLVGLEYTWFLNTLDFYGKYTNTFNANIQRDFIVKGEKMNMLGISVGLSF